VTTPRDTRSPAHGRDPQPNAAKGKSAGRVRPNLTLMGSAAVLAVYAAGFAQTKPAADRMAAW